VGYSPFRTECTPQNASPEMLEAERRHTFAVQGRHDIERTMARPSLLSWQPAIRTRLSRSESEKDVGREIKF